MEKEQWSSFMRFAVYATGHTNTKYMPSLKKRESLTKEKVTAHRERFPKVCPLLDVAFCSWAPVWLQKLGSPTFSHNFLNHPPHPLSTVGVCGGYKTLVLRFCIFNPKPVKFTFPSFLNFSLVYFWPRKQFDYKNLGALCLSNFSPPPIGLWSLKTWVVRFCKFLLNPNSCRTTMPCEKPP